jgi:hypothetical protein|tara:strand:- start:100 stop:717 length:618 start_codon:yes stop_codon:yes gene_type:complete
MAITRGPNIVRDGLVLCLDAKDPNSYPGSGSTWYDLSGNNFDYTLGNNLTYSNSNKTFIMSSSSSTGATNSSELTTSSACTLVFWIKTTEVQSLFWGGTGSTYYVGAYGSSNKEYYNNCGSPDYYQDTVEKSNIYDNIRDGNWHMVEFKNVNFSTVSWANKHYFSSYSGYEFGNGECAQILMYDRVLSSSESSQNYNSFKSRFGL